MQNKKEKRGKLGKNTKEKEKVKKKKRNALWITVVIHSAFGCGETVISPHPLVICINVYRKIMWVKKKEKRKKGESWKTKCKKKSKKKRRGMHCVLLL
jgi:hypothetical protein